MNKTANKNTANNIFTTRLELQDALSNWEKACTEAYALETKKKRELERLLKDLKKQIDYLSKT